MNECDLLREYVRTRSQNAFTRLSERYVNIVYAAARRQTSDAALAEDVTQAVFLLLSQKAATIPSGRPLSGWLLTTTRYCAANARRSRQKRELHERRAAEMARQIQNNADDESRLDDFGPLLDEGLAKLRAKDRDALLLKFFEFKTHSEVGGALGISEAAAIKRVNRAVDRLRIYFQRRGVALSIAALSTGLAAEPSKAAPAALVHAIAAAPASAATAPAALSITKGAMILVVTEKTKFAAITVAVLLFGIGGAVVAVKAIASHNTPRVIALAVNPTANVAAVASSPWRLTFAGGATVDILGLNDPAQPTGNWWLPDGSPIADLATDPSGADVVNRNEKLESARLGTRTIRLVSRARMNNPRRVWIELSPSLESLSAESPVKHEGNLIALVRSNQAAAKLRVGVAEPNWTNSVSFGPNGGKDVVVGDMAYLGIREENGEAIVHVQIHADPQIWADRSISVFSGGKELLPDSTATTPLVAADPAGARDVNYRYPCAIKDVTYIRLRSRRFEIQEIDNVSLYRGKQTSAAIPIQTGPTFPIQLSDGCVIETLGISDPDAKPAEWWAPNGVTEYRPNTQIGNNIGISPLTNQVCREFLFRMTGPVAGHSLQVVFGDSGSSAEGTMVTKDLIAHCMVALPARDQTTTINFLCSRGPWQTNEIYAIAATSHPADAHILSVSAAGKQTAAAITSPRDDQFLDRETHVVARLKSGTDINATSMSNSDQIARYMFPCPFEQVASIVIASRPYERVDMRNVALNPTTQPTSIEVTRAAPAATKSAS